MKKLTYDPQADAAYAYAYSHPSKVDHTVPINPDINIDFTSSGRAVGIEILHAKAILSKALGVKLTESQLKGIRFSMEDRRGLYLHLECEGTQASLVLPEYALHTAA